MLTLGTIPEEFTLPDETETEISWTRFRGAPVVVFFYPRANTPGCTKEACSFRDFRPEFEKRRVKIIGMSADSIKAQRKFRDAYQLTMPLLSDPTKKVLISWGVYGEKQMYGKTVQGVIRSTFLFDSQGKLVFVWPKVKVEGHVEQVLAKVDELFSTKHATDLP